MKLARKHTTHITRDLPRLVQGAVGRLMDRWHHQDTRLMTYKVTKIKNRTAHDLIVRATDVGVCPESIDPACAARIGANRVTRHLRHVMRGAFSTHSPRR